MKKKRIIIMLVLIVVVLVGCSKSADPKEVVTTFINHVIYEKDKEHAEKYFYQLEAPTEEELIQDFSDLFDLSKKEAKELVTIYQEKLEKETSFQVKMKDNTSKKQIAEVTVVGLEQADFDKSIDEKTEEELAKWLKNKGYPINQLDDIDKLSDEAQLNGLLKELENLNEAELNRIQFEAIKQTFKEMNAAKEPRKIYLEIEPDKKEKKYWKIVDEEKSFNDLLDAFQG